MGGYSNGNFPLAMLVHLGGKVYLPAGTAARWRWLVAQALAKYGVVLYITPGWNGYRPYDIQVEYRRDLGIYAAVPGTSSHGLVYRGQLVAALDVANWAALAPGNETLAWARFKALCRLAGFTVDFVTPQELWHIGDFNDVWAAPTFASGGNADNQEDEMSEKAERQIDQIYKAIFTGGPSMSESGNAVQASLAKIWNAVKPIRRDGKDVALRQEVADIKTTVYAQNAALLGMEAALKALATSKGVVDPDVIVKAAQDGVERGLRNVTFTASIDS